METCREAGNTFVKIRVIVGTILLNMPDGLPSFFGNFYSYACSYFRYRLPVSSYDIDANWMLSINLIFAVLGILSTNWIVERIGLRLSQLVGVVVFNIGTFLSYWSVQNSVIATAVTFMATCGYGGAMTLMLNYIYISRWMPKRVALVSAVVSSAFGFGSIISNVIITWHCNPNNLKPDTHYKSMVLFSQAEILDRFPYVFFMLGIYSFTVQVIGFLLLKDPPPLKPTSKENRTVSTDETVSTIENGTNVNAPVFTYQTSYSSDLTPTNTMENDHNSKDKNNLDTENWGKDAHNSGNKKSSPTDILDNDCDNLRPSEMLKTKSFYALWISQAFMSYGCLVVNNYYKLYGELYIKGDNFLTSITIFSGISTTLMRIAIGQVADSHSMKNCLILVMCLSAILVGFWCFTAIWNRWLYFVCTVVVSTVLGTMYIIYPLATLKLFGSKHYSDNYGILMTAVVVMNIASPPILSFLIQNVGWIYMILSCIAFAVLSLLFVVIVMPKDVHRWKMA